MWDLYKGEPDKSSSDEYESSETDKCSEDMQEIIEKRLHPFHERKIGLQNVGTRGGLVPPIQYETDESMLNKEDDIIKIFIPKKFRNNSKIIDENDYLSWFKENNDLKYFESFDKNSEDIFGKVNSSVFAPPALKKGDL